MFAAVGLSFVTPLALAGFLVLPVIWWLLRFTPPRPETVQFPPFRFLLDLVSDKENPKHTPWWLIALRLALAGLIILAIANPQVSSGRALLTGTGPVLIVLDDGWAAARDWDRRRTSLEAIVKSLVRHARPVALATTAPRLTASAITLASPADIAARAAALKPRPLAPDRLALLARLQQPYANIKSLEVIWLSNGLAGAGGKSFADGLAKLARGKARLTVLAPEPASTGAVLATPVVKGPGITFTAYRSATATPRTIRVDLRAQNTRSLASRDLTFAAGATSASATLELPLALRNQAARAVLAGERSAAGVHLFDDRWRRKTIGLVTGASLELAQPLLSPLYYVSRALAPIAEIRTAGAGEKPAGLIARGLSVLVLADVGLIAGKDRAAIKEFLAGGGVLVRFAGPRLASGALSGRTDELIPIVLRSGGRALGSALSWEKPQPLAPFARTSPFAGLPVDPAIKVTRQVLAQPSLDLSGKVWANLADGTPLVTAARRGKGLVVLFHITANNDWSNLPISGLFVAMLKRLVDIAPAATGKPAATFQTAGERTAAFAPVRTLNGFGQLVTPPPQAGPVAARLIDKARPSPRNPPGLYRRAGITRALNLKISAGHMRPLTGLGNNVTRTGYKPAPPKSWAGVLFALAFVLLLLDTLAALWISGAWQRVRVRRVAVCLAAGLIAVSLAPRPVLSAGTSPSRDEAFALKASLTTRIAYVLTGNRRIDAINFSGLTSLTRTIAKRTSIEPAPPLGINIENDEIVFFALLYWPVLATAKSPSPAAIAKIDRFMKNGGTIFFDTRDNGIDSAMLTDGASPPALALRRILSRLDIPALEPVPPQHVLTKAFYLLQSFPGRYAGGKLWVEATSAKNTTADGVSSIIIGSNDYAAAWARQSGGRHLYATAPGGERQREFAYRTGINIIMYALTGNYKADQVHVPALLERLGQ